MKNMNIFKEQGLSMIELLVALAISSFLILGITQVYLNNKSSYVFQQAQAANMDSSRFLQMILDEQISRAGYRRTPLQMLDDGFESEDAINDCAAFPIGGAVTRLADSSKVGFCLRYHPAYDGELSCDGNGATLDDKKPFSKVENKANSVIVRIEFESNNNLNEGRLLCNGVELVSGLADFRVEFMRGEEFGKDGYPFVSNPYINASDYTPSNNNIVRGLRYEALFAGPTNQSVGDSSPILANWTRGLAASSTARKRLEDNDNRRIYQAIASTQLLRNLAP